MPRGVMVRWNDRGFGFIKPDEGGEDCFVHVSGLTDGEGSVQEGDEVQFKIEYDDRKGKDRAVRVERVGGGGGGGRRGGGGRSRSRSRGGDRYGGGGGRSSFGGGGGGGEIRPGDWECPRCRINVFASKSECFKCGARKEDGGRRDDSRGRR